MFSVKNKIKEDYGFVLVFNDYLGFYYYDSKMKLKYASNSDIEEITDVYVDDSLLVLEELKKLFFCFDHTARMNIEEVMVYVLDKDSEIVNYSILNNNTRYLSLLKKTKKNMIEKYGEPFFNSFFYLPDINLKPKEKTFLNCCYPDFVTGDRESFLYNSILHFSRKKDHYVVSETVFSDVEPYATESLCLGNLTVNKEDYCFFFLSKITKKQYLKMKLAVNSDIMKYVRKIDSK